MRRSHIAHIISSPNSGGVERLVLGLSTHRHLADFNQSVICLHSLTGIQGDLSAEFRRANVPVHLCGVPYLTSIHRNLRQQVKEALILIRLTRLVTRLKVDVVTSHVPHYIHLQAKAALTYGRSAWAWTLHGYTADERSRSEFEQAANLSRRGRARITAVSQTTRADFAATGLARADECRVIYAGADTNRLNAALARDAAWRARLNIPPDALLFGSVGRLSYQKHFDLLIEAAALLLATGVPAYFVIAGDGPLQAELQAQIDALGMRAVFRLIGYQADIARFLRELDVFVLPSHFEGFPIALIEAMMMGVPCIAAPVGGVPELLANDGGILLQGTSAAALAGAMCALLDADAREAYGRRGAEAAQHYTLDHCAQQYAALYEELLTEPRSTTP